jgi:prepilin-type N-terminal cleavage/methylation domain-containing protein
MTRIDTTDQSGFTIVELMIATIVSSVILLVITFGIVHFTNDYYHGINASNTQATAQDIIDTISHSIEFNAGTTSSVSDTSQTGAFCAGTQIFQYSVGQKLTSAPGSANWGLLQLNNPSASCSALTPAQVAAAGGGTELLGKNMRLAYLKISQQAGTSIWNVDIRVAFGDADLLCRKSIGAGVTGSCKRGDPSYDDSSTTYIQGNDVVCKLQTGSQFCSIAHLTTSIGQRIGN